MRVLFLCPDNSARSQIAEAFCNMLGADGIEAYSAGLEPVGEIDPRAREVMREFNCDLSAQSPKSIEDLPGVEFSYVVLMGCDADSPLVKARMEIEWDVPDPRGMGLRDYRGVCDMVRTRVEKLLSAPRAMGD